MDTLSQTVGTTLKDVGYLTIPAFLNEGQVQQLRSFLDTYLRGGNHPTRVENDDFIYVRDIIGSDTGIHNLLHGLYVSQIPSILGCSTVEVVRDEAIVKRPRRTRQYPWHQDIAYFPRDREITSLIALSDLGPDRGGISIIPGSHKRGPIQHEKGSLGLAVQPDASWMSGYDIDLPSGTLLLLHPCTIHRGITNLSESPTESYTIVVANTDHA